jgi:hypothetical protein
MELLGSVPSLPRNLASLDSSISIYVQAHYVDHYYNNMACGVSDWSHMNLRLPLVEKTNNDCLKSTSTCGAAGT